MADDLESLNNASLREKCLQYGLPNVPVTDSSRKVLIRKLRASMGGTPSADAKKRRETMHVPKKAPVQEEVAPERNDAKISQDRAKSRRTIAAPLKHDVVDKPQVAPAPRQSIIEKPVKNNFAIGNLYHEEAKLGRSAVAPSTTSPSFLTKTGVMTTSYNQEIAPVLSAGRNDPIVFDDDSEEEAYQEPVTYVGTEIRKSGYQAPSTKSYIDTNVRKSIYQEPVSKPYVYEATVPKKTYVEPTMSKTKTSTYMPSESAWDARSPSNVTKRSTKTFQQHTNAESVVADDHLNTPYLSNFARSLERLKDDPISKLNRTAPGGVNHDQWTEGGSFKVNKRQKVHPDGDADVSGSFNQLLIALERKYQLKRTFAILVTVLIGLFIYVFFIM